jgi:hypothetical protein
MIKLVVNYSTIFNLIPTSLYYNIFIHISVFKQFHKISNNKYYYKVKQAHKHYTTIFHKNTSTHHIEKSTYKALIQSWLDKFLIKNSDVNHLDTIHILVYIIYIYLYELFLNTQAHNEFFNIRSTFKRVICNLHIFTLM